MINIYNLSESFSLALGLLLGIAVIAQTTTLLLAYYQKGLERQSLSDQAFELMILFVLIIFGLMLGQVLNAYKISLSVGQSFVSLRISVFIIIGILSVIVLYKKTKRYIILGLLGTLVILPVVENIFINYYPLLFFLAILIILFRSFIISTLTTKNINQDISAYSVIHAINTLKTGLLYSQSNGQILIVNNQMRNLMRTLTGKIYRNALEFYDFLTNEINNPNLEKVYLDNQIVYILPNSKAYMFTKQEVMLKKKTYIHISASDVSTQMALNKKLKIQNQSLQAKSKQLKQTIENLYRLSHEKELENIRSRTHDILGQHLSLMLRTLDSENEVDYKILKSVSRDLLSELMSEKKDVNYQDQVKKIQEVFSHIGVRITVDGNFPKDEKKAALILDVIRESTTNAVRHGFATEIQVKLEKKEKYHKICISNNGYTPQEKIMLGSGLEDMKRKVVSQGGNLDIKQQPTFTLNIILPGGE